MKKILLVALASVLTLSAMTSCGTETENGIFFPFTEIDSDTGIDIRIAGTFDSPRTLYLHCSTKKIYPCCNYSIKVEYKQHSNNIDIAFKGVHRPSICQTAVGPTRVIIDIGALSDGTYNLNLSLLGVTYTGVLSVSSDS